MWKPQNLQIASELLLRLSSQQIKSGDELQVENDDNEDDPMHYWNYSGQPRDLIDSCFFEIFLSQTLCTVLITITQIPNLISSYLEYYKVLLIDDPDYRIFLPTEIHQKS